MLRIRQKRRVHFADRTQASTSKSASEPSTRQATSSSTTSGGAISRQSRNKFRTSSKRLSQQPSNAPAVTSNRQRHFASLFMALMASSPLPIEADAETLEAAQKASSAPKPTANTKHKRPTDTVRVEEVRARRWKRFRYGSSVKLRKGKSRGRDEMEMDDLTELRGEERNKGGNTY